MEARKKKILKRISIILVCIAFFIGCVLFSLQIGVWYTESHWTHWSPDYQKTDITAILQKQTLNEDDYQTLYRQTGVTKLGIDDMLQDGERGRDKILSIQNSFFKKYKVTSRRFNPFTYTEEIDGVITICDVQPGDIIVTATTRVSWWRYGHAALIVNESGLIVESIGPGVKSKYNNISDFSYLADFLIVRPKVDIETRKQVAKYAEENLLGLTYRFSVGLFSEKYVEDIEISQCAHLVWYAYKKFGIDLDSTGTWLVKPQDMVLSEHVEVVQAFGFDLDTLWS